ncbi:MAG: aspartate aminotransferase family protein [Alphaproteobacteria bacterium]|nr:aspartate aminotransferase family protein [Alphaproteobacteria bacterium]
MSAVSALVKSDQEHIIHPLHFAKENENPLVVVEGRGEMLIDADGKQFIDGLSGLWNVNAGHGRKELAEVAAAQMSKLAFASAYSGATNFPAVRLAEKLVKLAYPNTSAVYFTTAGAESNESAFKIARFFWKARGKPDKVKIFSRVHAYHGVTMAAMSATGMAVYHKMFGPLVPNFMQVPAPYPYRWPGNGDPGIEAADAVEARILKEGADTVAAVIAEPVMGAGGVIVPPATYFPRLREICDRHDVLLITDEVITGFGRTGKWFALGHWGVEPDLTSFAKGVTSAYLPLGGVLVSKRVHKQLNDAPADQKFMHAATYSGHPVCCAVGLRNIELIESEGLVERAALSGRRLLAGLETLREFPVVGDVRGLGMMCGVELVESREGKKPAIGLGGKVVREAFQRGLLIRIRGGGADPAIGDTLCVAPPLMTPVESIDRIVTILREAIAAATR